MADSYLGVALQLASTLVISRLLTPTEIGIFSVAAVLAALASAFRDFGVAEYLIQEKNLTTEKIRAALTANIAISWLMAIVLFASSDMVASFYREPGIAEVMRILSVNFLLIPFGAVTMAYFRRELNYRPIFIAGLLANITSFAVATAAAFAGMGFMSLAWSSLAGTIVNVVVSIIARPKNFPRWPGLKGLAEVAHFGKHASGIYFVGQIGRSAPEAVIGRALDMASVAFFSRANGLMALFNKTVLAAVLPVCLPYFSQAARANQETKIGYLKATSLLAVIGWPFFMYMGLIAFSAIRLLYGPQWLQSVLLAQILCVVAILELPYYLGSEVMIAEGRIDQSNRLQFILQSLRLASLALVFPFGLPGACWGLVAAALCGAFVSHQFLHQIIGLNLSDVIRSIAPSAYAALISMVPPLLLVLFTGQTEKNHIYVFMGSGLVMAVSWLAALKFLRHPFWEEIDRLVGQIRKKLSRKAESE
ncbi:MAG: lipopolysaccharide biosynthesis protein [Propionivibrio sp.]|nr:lipopolysaccharide biosynthesis protein [Propionivibrio sp.]